MPRSAIPQWSGCATVGLAVASIAVGCVPCDGSVSTIVKVGSALFLVFALGTVLLRALLPVALQLHRTEDALTARRLAASIAVNLAAIACWGGIVLVALAGSGTA